MHRRQYLALAGSTAAVALAGCSGGDSNGNESDDESGNGDSNGNESGNGENTGDDSGTGNGGNTDGTDDTSDDNGSDATTGTGPTAVVREYYELANAVEPTDNRQAAIDQLMELLHSASPLADLIEDAEESNNPAESATVTNVETTVVDRNLDATTLEEEYPVGFIPTLTEEDLEAIAGANAIVETDVERADDDENVDRQTTWVVARESGEWKLFLNITRTQRGSE